MKTIDGNDIPYFKALTNDIDLKKAILFCLKSKVKINLKLQKFTFSDTIGPTNSLRRQRKANQTKQKPQNLIEFNSSGQVIRDKLQVLQERPHYQIHPIKHTDDELCVFCRNPSSNEELRVKCGPVYGPIRVKGGGAYVHELCALWTPEIFLDDKNKFKNLAKGIKRCNKIRCTLCKEKGGGLGCFIKNCDNSYHYLCAKIANCLFVNSKFIIYCEKHRQEAPDEYLEEEKLEEEQVEGLQHYICSICKSGLDEANIVICESCDRGFHTNCHDPIIDLETMDEDEEWYCRNSKKQESKTKSFGRGQVFQPRNYANQWVGNEFRETVEEEKQTPQAFSMNQRRQKPYFQKEVGIKRYQNNGWNDQPQLHQQKVTGQSEHRQSMDDIFEERVIQDKRSMNTCYAYKDFQTPLYFQGPQFLIYKEQHKSYKQQRYYNDLDYGYDQVQYQPKPQQYQKVERDFQSPKDDEVEVFNMKQEKRKGNQFWREEAQSKNMAKQKPKQRQRVKPTKGNSPKIQLTKRDSKQEKRNGNKKVLIKQISGKKEQVGSQQRRLNYEEYLPESEIKKGLDKGTLFEGILKINQNNRRRAYVSVDGIIVDILIDGLMLQNRAMDGDTVVVELTDPFKWFEYTSNNVVVGKNATGQNNNLERMNNNKQGYTNETAVETRIIDMQQLGTGSDEFDKAELKAVTKEYQIQKSSELKKEKSQQVQRSQSQSEGEHMSVESEDSNEQLMDKALYEAEEANSEGDEDVGTGFIDDEQVQSSDDEEQKYDQRLRKAHEEEEKKASVPKAKVRVFVDKLSGTNKADRLKEINQIAKDLRPMGKVKAIIKSPNREKEHLVTLMALEKDLMDPKVLQQLTNGSKNNAASSGIYAVPVSKKLPWMTLLNIPEEFINDIKNNKKPQNRYYLAKIQNWNTGFIRPICKVLSSIGEAGNLEAESLRILKQHDIWSDEYETEGQKINEKVHECLRVFTKDLDPITGEWRIPEDELQKRLDLRNKRIFTIDPITAKDLDDALSIEKINDTIYEIGVHIADVSYFVQQGTDLDKEAQLRCTSVYFVHRVYPMLPRLLCERLCSLNPNVDRLAYSIFFRMDIRNGEIDRSFQPKLARSVINSCAKWNYQLVQDILDGKITQESQLEEKYRPIGQKFNDMRNDCFLMNEIAQKRRKKRLDNGSIMLQNREFIFLLDQESRMPLGFQESYRMPSKYLVEEYMLLANILVAEHLQKHCQDKTLLRIHPDLDVEKKTKLKAFFDKVGLGEIDLTDGKTLSITLENLRDRGDSCKFNVAMRKFLTCLQCAKYMCINECDPPQYQHFGLNFPLYTHFTSPIRRYADLLVHRLVTLTLQHQEKTRELIELMDYSNYADMCSEKSYNAKRASTQCTRLFHCLLLKSHGTKVFETLLFDMDQGNITVYIDEINIHHKIRLRDDERIDSVIYFEEQLTVVAHLKNPKSKGGKNQQDKLDLFKKIKSLDEFDKNFAPEEFLIFRIFDKIKVKVETTTEFPLDIKCTLIFTKEDNEEYEKILCEQDARVKAQAQAAVEIHVDEIENLDNDV